MDECHNDKRVRVSCQNGNDFINLQVWWLVQKCTISWFLEFYQLDTFFYLNSSYDDTSHPYNFLSFHLNEFQFQYVAIYLRLCTRSFSRQVLRWNLCEVFPIISNVSVRQKSSECVIYPNQATRDVTDMNWEDSFTCLVSFVVSF